jgi:hypothetical protein
MRPKEIVTSGRVLVLSWELCDISSTANEVGLVRQLFEDGFNYGVEQYSIPLNSSVAELRAKLHNFLTSFDATTLAIVYYKGHGGLYHNELYFTRQAEDRTRHSRRN